MNSYNKQALDIIAKEQGFIRDNLEKVMRLVEILNYFHDSPLLSKSLVLKGGTAINLTVFQLPRLSVDIDLDFTVDCDRESMLSIRQEVNNEILRYMESDGYHLAPGSKTPHTLDSWVFHYTNAAGNNDGIKIEINYSDRCHILPAIETHVSIPFLSDVKVRSLSPVELFATKINALIGRSAEPPAESPSTMKISHLEASLLSQFASFPLLSNEYFCFVNRFVFAFSSVLRIFAAFSAQLITFLSVSRFRSK